MVGLQGKIPPKWMMVPMGTPSHQETSMLHYVTSNMG